MFEPDASCTPWSGTAATTGSSNVANCIVFLYIPTLTFATPCSASQTKATPLTFATPCSASQTK
jgi:hypothetical protein